MRRDSWIDGLILCYFLRAIIGKTVFVKEIITAEEIGNPCGPITRVAEIAVLLPNGTHPNEKGYAAWAKAMEPTLAKLWD